MVLLTSGQVSVAVSAGVIIVFTFALFISGYILQQQTLRGLQEAVKPRHPLVHPSLFVNPDAAAATVMPVQDARDARDASRPGSEDQKVLGSYSQDEAQEEKDRLWATVLDKGMDDEALENLFVDT